MGRSLPGVREVPVPASSNDVFADASVRDYVGEVWYQTSVRVPERWAGERSCCASTPRRTEARHG